MTLSPYESRLTADEPRFGSYDPPAVCAVPGCNERAGLERHHMNRRSDVTPSAWVHVTFDGIEMLLPNIVRLCTDHHRAVTGGVGGHKAHIRFDFKTTAFEWWVKVKASPARFQSVWENRGPLDPPPPTNPGEAEEPSRWLEDETLAHVHRPDRDPCPRCNGTGERPPKPPNAELEKPKRQYGIAIPKQAQPDGHESLLTNLQHAAELLGRGGHVSWQYYTVQDLCALLIRNKDRLIAEGDIPGESDYDAAARDRHAFKEEVDGEHEAADAREAERAAAGE